MTAAAHFSSPVHSCWKSRESMESDTRKGVEALRTQPEPNGGIGGTGVR